MKAREEIEQHAATLLGNMLFEFSRLDVNLGLCVVWTDGGRRLAELTKQIQGFTFHKKLEFLNEHVECTLSKDSKKYAAYIEWIARAHVLRSRRNQLVHGRWGVDAIQGHVINVVGLPILPGQREYRYTLTDLEGELDKLKQLLVELNKLRERWPL